MEPRLWHAVQIMTRCHEHPNGRSRVLIQENWQCVARGIWRPISILHCWQCGTTVRKQHTQVRLLSTSSRCLNVALYWKGIFLFPVGKHLAQTTFTRSNKTCLLPLSAIPSPIVLHNISMHLTLNKLFRKASCRLQTVCTKQHEIIRCFNV